MAETDYRIIRLNYKYSKDIYLLRSQNGTMSDTFKVSQEEHDGWYRVKLSNTNNHYFGMVIEDKLIGYIRFDDKETHHTISIAIDEKYQGKGIASKALKTCLSLLEKTKNAGIIIARIHKDNLSSLRLFQRNKFIRQTIQDDPDFYEYIYYLEND